ncbi:MAG: hypothetical protein WCS80_01110 [Bacilli bacterium]
MKDKNRTQFPLKRCLLATIVILLCALMVLALLYGIANSAKIPDKTWIFVVVWASLTGASVIGYWIYQSVLYVKIRKAEKE